MYSLLDDVSRIYYEKSSTAQPHFVMYHMFHVHNIDYILVHTYVFVEDDRSKPSLPDLLSCLYERDTISKHIQGYTHTLTTTDAATKIQSIFRMYHQRTWYIEYTKR